jgi:hypothetical protein
MRSQKCLGLLHKPNRKPTRRRLDAIKYLELIIIRIQDSNSKSLALPMELNRTSVSWYGSLIQCKGKAIPVTGREGP